MEKGIYLAEYSDYMSKKMINERLAYLKREYLNRPIMAFLPHPIPVRNFGLKKTKRGDFWGWDVMYFGLDHYALYDLINFLCKQDDIPSEVFTLHTISICDEWIDYILPLIPIPRTVVQSLSSTSSGEVSGSEGSNPDDFV